MHQCKQKAVLALLSVAITLICPGCNTMPGAVGNQIAKELPTLLGPADHYDVNVSGNIFDVMRGKIDAVKIHGVNVAMSPALKVSDFQADAEDIHADVRTQAIKSIGSTTFDIALDQFNLENYMMTARAKEYNDGARIGLNQRNFTFSNKVHWLGFATPYTVTGVLIPRPGTVDQLDFVPSGASVAKIGIPLKLVQLAADRENPVVDLSSMKYPVAIRTTQVKDGKLLMHGTVDLVAVMNAAQTAVKATSDGQ